MGNAKANGSRGPSSTTETGGGAVKAAGLLDELVDIAREDAKALRKIVSGAEGIQPRALSDEESKRLASYMRALTDVERARAPKKGDLDAKTLEALVEEAMEIPEFREIMEKAGWEREG
jgi:hypothetical protein